MEYCTSLKRCPFFNDRMQNMPATAELFKEKYCRGNFSDCARYKVASTLGKENVPSNMFPNQVQRAQEIMESKLFQ